MAKHVLSAREVKVARKGDSINGDGHPSRQGDERIVGLSVHGSKHWQAPRARYRPSTGHSSPMKVHRHAGEKLGERRSNPLQIKHWGGA